MARKKKRGVSEFEKQVIAGMKQAVAVHLGEILPARITMLHKGYRGVAVPDAAGTSMHGEIVNTRDVITFVGNTAAEVEKSFEESVEDYLEFCKKLGRKPETPSRKPWQPPAKRLIPKG